MDDRDDHDDDGDDNDDTTTITTMQILRTAETPDGWYMASAARLDATNCWHRVAASANAGTNSAHTPLPRDGAGGMRKILFALGKRPPCSM